MSSRLSSFSSSMSSRIHVASAGDAGDPVAKVTAPAYPVGTSLALCAIGGVVEVKCRLVLALAFITLSLLLQCLRTIGPVGLNTMLKETLGAS